MEREQQVENFLDHREEYELINEFAQHFARMVSFRRELQQIDPLLDILYAKKGAQEFPKDEFFYIFRRNPNTVPTYWMVHDGQGNYCEPDDRHLERMRGMDTSRSHAVMQAIERERAAKAARKERAHAERVDHFESLALEKINHVFDGRIAVPAGAVDGSAKPGPGRRKDRA